MGALGVSEEGHEVCSLRGLHGEVGSAHPPPLSRAGLYAHLVARDGTVSPGEVHNRAAVGTEGFSSPTLAHDGFVTGLSQSLLSEIPLKDSMRESQWTTE